MKTFLDLQSLQNYPTELPPGAIDPTIRSWTEAKKRIDDFRLKSSALNAISAVGIVFAASMVTILNLCVTAPAMLVNFTRLNNLLDEEIRYAIDKNEALKFRNKRLKYDSLKKFAGSERNKIINLINKRNNALSSTSPDRLASSKQIVFNNMADIMPLPESFWAEFLSNIYEDHSETIEFSIGEIDGILKDDEKVKKQLKSYKKNLKVRAAKYNNLKAEKKGLEKRISQSKGSVDIKLQKRLIEVSRNLDNILSKADKSALNSSSERHLIKAIKQNLKERKAFLEMIKNYNDNSYIVETQTSWTKTTFKGLLILGMVASGIYVYNNGVPTKDELFKMAQTAIKHIPSCKEIKTDLVWAWNNPSDAVMKVKSMASKNADWALKSAEKAASNVSRIWNNPSDVAMKVKTIALKNIDWALEKASVFLKLTK